MQNLQVNTIYVTSNYDIEKTNKFLKQKEV